MMDELRWKVPAGWRACSAPPPSPDPPLQQILEATGEDDTASKSSDTQDARDDRIYPVVNHHDENDHDCDGQEDVLFALSHVLAHLLVCDGMFKGNSLE